MSELALVVHELGGTQAPARNAVDLVLSGVPGSRRPEQEELLGGAARASPDGCLLQGLVRCRRPLPALVVPAVAARAPSLFAAAAAGQVTAAVEDDA